MFRIRLTYLFFALALIVSTVLPASAQTQQPQLYLPQVGISSNAIGEGPAPLDPDFNFIPLEEMIEDASSGYSNFYCGYGQLASHRWYAHGPGYISATWWEVNVSGVPYYHHRTYYFPTKGYGTASIRPGSSGKITRIVWNTPMIAVNSGSSCKW